MRCLRMIKKRVQNTVGRLYLKIGLYWAVWLTAFLSAAAFADDTDQLADLKPDLAANFGTGSTAIELVYLAEIITGAVAYSKTKNPLVLGGIVALSLFLNFALKHWGISQ